ncbi:MAG: 3-isopropylmalate dehydrogenase [Gemmatimonadaceae bacterium]|nr:3-isopropylmalate dehydrogenase [Gemmatimonadaceae bacterium]
MKATVTVLPGDGIGPEVTAEALRVLRHVSRTHGIELTVEEALIGGCAIDATGDPLPSATREAVQRADAVLLGAVGGPKWGTGAVRPEQGLLGLRKLLGTYANLRPVCAVPVLAPLSPVKDDRLANVDILFVRELTAGVYFGEKRWDTDPNGSGRRVVDECVYTEGEIERIARVAGTAARARRGRVTSIDKANVMETSRFWREVTSRIFATEFPDVQLDHLLADAFTMLLIQRPSTFDVVVADNLFGDLVTDEAAVLAGSIGLLPSASLGERRRDGTVPGLYEPIHGSAPDIAGQGKANPAGTILSVAMMLRHSFSREHAAAEIEAAVYGAINAGVRTADCVQPGEIACTTTAFTDAVLSRLG